MKDTVFVDIETTGLNPIHDEILSVAVIDENNKVLFDEKIKPMFHDSWGEAEKINHISYNSVQNCETYAAESIRTQLMDIFKGKNVVAYNARFDCTFLREVLTEAKSIHCAMNAFTAFNNGNRISLSKAVYQIDPQYEYEHHTALADTYALRLVWNYLKENFLNRPLPFDFTAMDKFQISFRNYTNNKDLVKKITESGDNDDLFSLKACLYATRNRKVNVLMDYTDLYKMGYLNLEKCETIRLSISQMISSMYSKRKNS